jgi:uncharacterized protein
LAQATGIPNLYPIDEGRMRNTLLVATRDLDIRHLNIEAGGGAWGREETLGTMVRGIRNVLRSLHILSGEPEDLPEAYYLRRSNMLSSTTGGFFRAEVRLGQRVRAGEVLGRVVNLLNHPIEVISAPADAFVQDLKTIPRVWPGDWLVLLGQEERVI